MTRTCSCTNSCGCKVCLRGIDMIDCFVVRAQWSLYSVLLKLQQCMLLIYTLTCLTSFPVFRCNSYCFGSTIYLPPGERAISSSGCFIFRCSAEKLPSMAMLLVYNHLKTLSTAIPEGMQNQYLLGSSSHSWGRLIPGWGHAGQKIARLPGWSSAFVSWPNPEFILAFKSLHILETLISSRYRSLGSLADITISVDFTYRNRLWTWKVC